MELEGSTFIIHKCINFGESRRGRKSKDLEMKVLEIMVKKTQFEVEDLAMDTSSLEGTIRDVSYYHFTCD